MLCSFPSSKRSGCVDTWSSVKKPNVGKEQADLLEAAASFQLLTCSTMTFLVVSAQSSSIDHQPLTRLSDFSQTSDSDGFQTPASWRPSWRPSENICHKACFIFRTLVVQDGGPVAHAGNFRSTCVVLKHFGRSVMNCVHRLLPTVPVQRETVILSVIWSLTAGPETHWVLFIGTFLLSMAVCHPHNYIDLLSSVKERDGIAPNSNILYNWTLIQHLHY